MTVRKKREGLAGILLTAVLCAGFLYWWFRPEPPAWQDESPRQLTARAAAEPAPASPAERWVLDADFIEVALLHARTGDLDEALNALAPVSGPLMQSVALRQLALAHLTSGEDNLSRALEICAKIPDPTIRAAARREVLSILARLGFADVALSQADSPILKATVAQVLAETDGADKARALAADLLTALPSLPPADQPALREALAWISVRLALYDGPTNAITTVAALPPASQNQLWIELFRVCFGRDASASSDAAAVLTAIPDLTLKRQLELEALESNVVLRLPDEILIAYEDAAVSAPQGPEKIIALTSLATARQRCGRTDAATEALQQAHRMALALPNTPEKPARLLALAAPLTDATLLDEAAAVLTEAAAAIDPLPPSAQLPLLASLADEQFNQADAATATATALKAAALLPANPSDASSARLLASFFIRLGNWPAGFAIVANQPPSPARDTLLDSCATLAAEDSLGYDPIAPPLRGEPIDGIRKLAAGDESRVVHLIERQPPGFPRARAWLAMAKGMLSTTPAALPPALPPPLPDDALPPENDTPVPLPPTDPR
jgi:hypothetical protein